MDNVAVTTEAARKHELQQEGMIFGRARGDGNCLISSILQGLIHVEMVPKAVVENPLRFSSEVRSCRDALVALPAGHVLRPVERDLLTNRINAAATDEEHQQAYLQFDVHGIWIVEYFMERHGREIPDNGLVLKCFSRFDDILGEVPQVSIYRDANVLVPEPPHEIAMYNLTGTGFCGEHYDPLFFASVPPPPPAPASPGSERPQKRHRSSGSGNRTAKADSAGASRETQSATNPRSTPADKAHLAEASFYKIAVLPTGDQNHGDQRDLLQQALELVAENLREDPTLPGDPIDSTQADPDALREDAAVVLQPAHCAFAGCTRTFVSGEDLSKHLEAESEHIKLLSAVTRCMAPSQDSEQLRRFSAYCEAIACKIRQGAPLDTYSIDRRAIMQYSMATADDQIYMPMCFSCARRFPHIASLDKQDQKPKNEIRWQKPLSSTEDVKFFGMGAQRCAEIFGLDTYIERYGHQPGFPDMRERMAEFDDWQLIVPFRQRSLTLLCCPEDRKCTSENKSSCMARGTLCKDCEVPVCRYCEEALLQPRGAQMPYAALTNDLMIFYAPVVMYEKQATAMELICASVCLTTMISFTLEKKHRGKERLFDQPVHMQRHTIGTRGNATSFPMPWEEILRMLQDVDQTDDAGAVDLPHSGEELVRWAQVLLKTSGDEGVDDLKGLVHQASVRADVVVALIEEMKNRGHRAYKNLDMERVRRKAKDTLPHAGVPPEIMHLVKISSEDDSLDRIQIQKEATPVAGRCQSHTEAEQLFSTLSPNAVVCERSSEDAFDVVAQRAAAFQDIGNQLEKNDQGIAKQASRGGSNKPSKIAVSAGNSMIDQFKPWSEPPSLPYLFIYIYIYFQISLLLV